jgi:preprotein translocase subunit YajC
MTREKGEVTRRSMMALVLIAFSILGWLVAPRPAATQNSQVQQSVNEMKESAARSKQALAQYRWQQQETVSVKGKQKKQDLFQVELEPDGKQLRTPMAQDQDTSSSESQHGLLKRKLTEKKTGELIEYAQRIKELAQSYAPPDPARLQQAYQQGNVSIGAGGAAGEVRLVVHDYVKPGDTVTFSLNREQKEIQGIEVSSYLNDPKDAVTLSAQFERLPDGTNHISEMLVNGVSKQLTVTIKNFNFQKI